MMPKDRTNLFVIKYFSLFAAIFALAVAGPVFPAEPEKKEETEPVSRSSSKTPENLKIAFTGDTDVNQDAAAVLSLVAQEGAEALIHNGDLGYGGIPQDFEDQINSILGEEYPYFFSAGNHDDEDWFIPNGYKELGEVRMNRLGIPWDGEYGIRSSFYYKDIYIILTAPDVFLEFEENYDEYIREQLAADNSIWRICSWHKNMNAMQVYSKGDETGWGVYEESRKGGAIITTGHAHTYSRSYQMSDLDDQVIASTSDTIRLIEDDPETSADEGNTFVHVSGLGGRNIKPQLRDGEWWASIYTLTQNATYGALFGVFNYRGDRQLAYFYFKNIEGEIIDEFFVRSTLDDRYSLNAVVTPAEAGIVTFDPAGGLYEDGTSVTVTAVPAEGFAFDHWNGDLNGSENSQSITMNADKSITALFRALPSYTLEVSIDGSGAVDVNPPNGPYYEGTIVILIAKPDSGWLFNRWSGDLESTENPDTMIMDHHKNVTTIFIEETTSGIPHQAPQAPARYALYQNYPNPFNPATVIKFDLPQKEFVTLTVYDLTGRKVAALIKNTMVAGQYQINFDGLQLGSGIYLYRLRAGSFQASKKMILLK